LSGLTDARRRRQKGGPAEGLPELPRMRVPSDSRKRERVTVVIEGELDRQPAAGAAWGGADRGRYVGGGAVRDVLGVCEKCGRMRRAWDLVDKIRPFGRGEIRQCRGGCA
jgi:hypothetical protein